MGETPKHSNILLLTVVQQWVVILRFSQEKKSAHPSTLPSCDHINILGISELKWTGMGEFNSDDHYIYYCGQESLSRNGVAVTVNKRVWNAVLGSNLKNDRIISVCFQGTPFYITIIQVTTSMSNAKEAEVEWFYEDLKDLLELTHKKGVLFIIATGRQSR